MSQGSPATCRYEEAAELLPTATESAVRTVNFAAEQAGRGRDATGQYAGRIVIQNMAHVTSLETAIVKRVSLHWLNSI